MSCLPKHIQKKRDPQKKRVVPERVLQRRKVYHVGMAKLTESLENIESGYIPESRFQGINQKNWAPLEFNNTLYFVVRTEPLIINKLDASGSSIYQSGPAIQTSLQAVSCLPQFGGVWSIPIGPTLQLLPSPGFRVAFRSSQKAQV